MTRLLGSVLVAGAALWGWQRQRAERRLEPERNRLEYLEICLRAVFRRL